MVDIFDLPDEFENKEFFCTHIADTGIRKHSELDKVKVDLVYYEVSFAPMTITERGVSRVVMLGMCPKCDKIYRKRWLE